MNDKNETQGAGISRRGLMKSAGVIAAGAAASTFPMPAAWSAEE